MKRGWKIALGVVGGIVVIVAGAAVTANVLSESKRNRVIEVKLATTSLTNDASAVGHGKYLFESRGCSECHGADGGIRA